MGCQQWISRLLPHFWCSTNIVFIRIPMNRWQLGINPRFQTQLSYQVAETYPWKYRAYCPSIMIQSSFLMVKPLNRLNQLDHRVHIPAASTISGRQESVGTERMNRSSFSKRICAPILWKSSVEHDSYVLGFDDLRFHGGKMMGVKHGENWWFNISPPFFGIFCCFDLRLERSTKEFCSAWNELQTHPAALHWKTLSRRRLSCRAQEPAFDEDLPWNPTYWDWK